MGHSIAHKKSGLFPCPAQPISHSWERRRLAGEFASVEEFGALFVPIEHC